MHRSSPLRDPIRGWADRIQREAGCWVKRGASSSRRASKPPARRDSSPARRRTSPHSPHPAAHESMRDGAAGRREQLNRQALCGWRRSASRPPATTSSDLVFLRSATRPRPTPWCGAKLWVGSCRAAVRDHRNRFSGLDATSEISLSLTGSPSALSTRLRSLRLFFPQGSVDERGTAQVTGDTGLSQLDLAIWHPSILAH